MYEEKKDGWIDGWNKIVNVKKKMKVPDWKCWEKAWNIIGTLNDDQTENKWKRLGHKLWERCGLSMKMIER